MNKKVEFLFILLMTLLCWQGQGPLGLEIMEDLPEATDIIIIISIGCGGFADGVCTAIKALKQMPSLEGINQRIIKFDKMGFWDESPEASSNGEES